MELIFRSALQTIFRSKKPVGLISGRAKNRSKIRSGTGMKNRSEFKRAVGPNQQKLGAHSMSTQRVKGFIEGLATQVEEETAKIVAFSEQLVELLDQIVDNIDTLEQHRAGSPSTPKEEVSDPESWFNYLKAHATNDNDETLRAWLNAGGTKEWLFNNKDVLKRTFDQAWEANMRRQGEKKPPTGFGQSVDDPTKD